MLTTIALSLLGVAVPALFGWVVQVQSDVKVLQADYKSLEKLIEQKFDNLEESLNYRHEANEKRLERIERALNGNLYR